MNKIEKRFSFLPSENVNYRANISGDTGSRHIKGTGIIFNQKSKILTEFVPETKTYRSFNEIISTSALDRILNNGFDVVMDVNHSFDEILARTASKTLTLTKSETGIQYEFDAPNTSRGEDVLQMIARGDYYESSFAFVVADGGDTWEYDEITGLYTRTINNIEALYDMAICTYRGAYDNTSVKIEENPQANGERIFKYDKEDIEVALRTLDELQKPIITTTENKPNKKYNEDFVTRIYLKRNWQRKQQTF